ncbi:hypothetical protein ACPWT1_19845 [Ramlibacter sp. MMS24-I3-19]|uniref:hypothetical protein n=1 Tax=Ramlibacter sp. MMS24-I3-19 TaxID=3416606 RepID=UPI003D018131
MRKSADLSKRADELIAEGKALSTTKYREGSAYGVDYVDEPRMAGFRSACLSFLQRVYGSSHPHYAEFAEHASSHYYSSALKGVAILESVKREIDGGWLSSVRDLVSAEVFSDFLEMADHLLEAGYKDPAAVMIGSVLEERLRQLCAKNGLETTEDKDGRDVPKRADRLNADLAKAEVYSKLDQKLITAWLDLRNKAAHGNYGEYDASQVRHMATGVTEFLVRASV